MDQFSQPVVLEDKLFIFLDTMKVEYAKLNKSFEKLSEDVQEIKLKKDV